jgi:hypothetical protein
MPRRGGRNFATGSSSETLPWSSSMSMSVADMVLVTEAIHDGVSTVIGLPSRLP